MKPTVKGINLLPKEYIQAQKVKIYLLIAAAALVLECIVFIISVVVPPIAKINSQEAQIVQLEQDLASPKYQEVNKTINELNTAKEDVKKWVDKCKSINNPDIVSGQLLDELIARLPLGVTVDKMEIKALNENGDQSAAKTSSIKFSGRTTSPEPLVHYMATLEALYQGVSIDYKFEKPESNSNYQKYTMTVKIPMNDVSTTVQAVSGTAPAQTTSSAVTTSPASATTEGGTQS